MNRLIFLLVFISTSILSWSSTETIHISYSLDDFSFSSDKNGRLHISTSKSGCYPETNEPGLPVFAYEMAMQGKYFYTSSNVRFEKKLVKSNVIVAQSPIPVPTNGSVIFNQKDEITYTQDVFPKINFVYTSGSSWMDLSVFRFLVCPFIYDAKERNLYFIPSFDVDIVVATDDNSSRRITSVNSPYIFRKRYDKQFGIVQNPLKSQTTKIDEISEIDYVIITADSLKEAFEPLLEWKKTKGLRSRIVTIEYIMDNYPGLKSTVKVKNCLRELYFNNGLKYALLGGDDSIVPVQNCYCDGGSVISNNIPTDLFYACFDGDFEWDANRNDTIGEPADSISLDQYISVTRVPIRTKNHVSAFISKLLDYEKNPKWNNNILTGGNLLFHYIKPTFQSDAEGKGDNLYKNYIQPYWTGRRTKFYDTMTDFSEGEEYEFTAAHLSEQMSQGYDFIELMTHGSQTTWQMEFEEPYDSTNGAEQINNKSSIITTTACLTNAFNRIAASEDDEACLSESLIRNPSSGVIAYLGCSKEGMDHPGEHTNGTAFLGPSSLYEAIFYQYLFSNDVSDKNFGTIVAFAKTAMIPVCLDSRSNGMRWIQFGLNPIGDPEMPVFIEQPKLFNNLRFEQIDNEITINTGVKDCRICIKGLPEMTNSLYKVFDYTDNLTLENCSDLYSICITKQGYIPALYYISHDAEKNIWHIQNERLVGSNSFTFDNVNIGSNVSNVIPGGCVEINAGSTIITAKSAVIKPGVTIKKGVEFKIKNK